MYLVKSGLSHVHVHILHADKQTTSQPEQGVLYTQDQSSLKQVRKGERVKLVVATQSCHGKTSTIRQPPTTTIVVYYHSDPQQPLYFLSYYTDLFAHSLCIFIGELRSF